MGGHIGGMGGHIGGQIGGMGGQIGSQHGKGAILKPKNVTVTPGWRPPGLFSVVTGLKYDVWFLTLNTSPLHNFNNCLIDTWPAPESLPDIHDGCAMPLIYMVNWAGCLDEKSNTTLYIPLALTFTSPVFDLNWTFCIGPPLLNTTTSSKYTFLLVDEFVIKYVL